MRLASGSPIKKNVSFVGIYLKAFIFPDFRRSIFSKMQLHIFVIFNMFIFLNYLLLSYPFYRDWFNIPTYLYSIILFKV